MGAISFSIYKENLHDHDLYPGAGIPATRHSPPPVSLLAITASISSTRSAPSGTPAVLVIRSEAQVDAVADPELRQLLLQLVNEFRQYDGYSHSELVNFIVIEHGDDIHAIDTQLGFPILGNRWSGLRFGQPGFVPCFELLEEHQGWFEMVYVLSDDGYGVEVFIPKSAWIPPELLALCTRHATPGQT